MAQLKVGVLINAKENATKSIRAVGKAMKGAARAASAVGAAAAAAGAATVAAADKQRQAEQGVALALAKNNSLTQENIQALADQASAIQSTTTVGDEQILTYQSMALALGASVDQATSMSKAAIDMSAAVGVSADTAMRGLSQTIEEGKAGLLGRYIPALRTMTEEQLKAGGAIELVRKRFGGFAQNEAMTMTGAFKQIANVAGDEMERVGFAIQQSGAVKSLLKNKDAIIEIVKDIGKFWAERVTGMIDNFAQFGLFVSDAFFRALGVVMKFAKKARLIWVEMLAFWGQKLSGAVDKMGGVLRAIGIDVGDIGGKFDQWVTKQQEAARHLNGEYKIAVSGIDDAVAAVTDKIADQSLAIYAAAESQQTQSDRLKEQVELYKSVNDQAGKRADEEERAARAMGGQNIGGQQGGGETPGVPPMQGGGLATGIVGPIASGLSQALDQSPNVQAIIQGIARGDPEAVRKLQEIKVQQQRSAVQTVTGVSATILSTVNPLLGQVVSTIGGPLINSILENPKQIGEKLSMMTSNIVDVINGVAANLGEAVSGILTKIPEIATKIISAFPKLALDMAVKLPIELIKSFPKMVKMLVKEMVIELPKAIAKALADIIKGAFKKIGGIFKKTGRGIKRFFKGDLFHAGGIVGGNASSVGVVAKPGEAILTRTMQANLLRSLGGAGQQMQSAPTNVTINAPVDVSGTRDPREAADLVLIGLRQLWRSGKIRSNPITAVSR